MSGLAVFAEGAFDDTHAKTAHGVLRYSTREVTCVIDSRQAGRSARDVVPYVQRDVPIVSGVHQARALGADRILIGVAPSGGRLEPAWREALREGLRLGMSVEAGLHTLLSEDDELRTLADTHHTELVDLRASPHDLSVPRGVADRDAHLQVVHTVGTDCAIGKMTVTLELDRAARARGQRSVFAATGQTGIAISGWGIAVDHVIADYIAGAAERLVDDAAGRGELVFVEGQGSLYHPAYSGVTLGLLHGCAPDVLVLCHRAGVDAIDDYPEVRLPALSEVAGTYERAAAPIRPAAVAAIALNTTGLDARQAQRAIDEAAAGTGLMVDDPVRNGADALLDAVLARLTRSAEGAAERG